MKASGKNRITDRKKVPDAGFGRVLPLVPKWLFYPLAFISLALPNLIYSGISWFDTLHIMKWAWTMVPIALLSLAAGLHLAVRGPERTGFRFDAFSAVWFFLLTFISLQPLWTDIFARSTYMKEWFFFASLFAAYLLCYNLFDSGKAWRCVLWLANINAAVNIVFAELLIRDMNGICSLIMNVPGNYIGNTGQQEMFGLWMAMCVMNCVILHVVYTRLSSEERTGKGQRCVRYLNLLMLAFVSWGLWNSTTRAGVLSLFVGMAVSAAVICRNMDRKLLKPVWTSALIVALVLLVNICMGHFGWSRAYSLISKTSDMLVNMANVGARREIWMTSWNVVKEHPVAGVGLGHFKWHYLEAQGRALRAHPWMKWQFTYWAHCEYLQWLAEMGIFGAAVLLAAAIWWLIAFVRALRQRRPLSDMALWGCALIFLICFDALFSRPFHRIENAVWLSFAFAAANRELFSPSGYFRGRTADYLYRSFGVFIAAASAAGMIFLASGCIADKHLRAATLTNRAVLQRSHIDAAARSLMERDEAKEQLAYHLLSAAAASGRPEAMRAGTEQLARSFMTRPHGKLFFDLLEIAKQTNNRRLLDMLVPYLHPNVFGGAPAASGEHRQ
ncbi:MAG: O-antigen ligase family protein [Synergistes sp.]|nr:O-antigen ligase family protein [Synergistes sp.]